MPHETDNALPPGLEPPARLARASATRFALQISLGLHALLTLALLRVCIEYGRAPEPPLHIVVRGSAPDTAATPSFEVTHVAVAEATDNSIRPSAALAPLPHQGTSLTAAAPFTLPITQPQPRRVAAALATLPSTIPVLEALDAEIRPLPAAEGGAPLPASRVAAERTESLPDMPLRIALRPANDRREQRPFGLAALPTFVSDDRRREPADAFQHRFVAARTPRPNRAAIERGLEYLARVQFADGRWRFDNLEGVAASFPRPTSLRSDAAATGLVLLAFLGAGHDHFGGRYQFVVEDSIDFLVRIQHREGAFSEPGDDRACEITSFYSHGIATLALCEAFGMTGDAEVRAPAQSALNHLAMRLESELRWSDGQSIRQNDWSVIGWQLATLRSGRLAGLNVDADALARISASLAALEVDAASSDAMQTAIALAVELHLGSASAASPSRTSADELLAHSGESEPRRDTYFWYYGSQAMYYLGGDDWQAWSRELYPRLIESQVAAGTTAGSWQPPVATESARPDAATRLYVTAMNLLSLETQQRQPPRTASVLRVEK